MTPYEETNQLKNELGIDNRIDILALAPGNDPFWKGTLGDVEKAEWFAKIWRDFGESESIHLRQYNYKCLAKQIKLPDGNTYTGSRSNWTYLSSAAKAARNLGLIPLDCLPDRQMQEEIFNNIQDTNMPYMEAPWHIPMYMDISIPPIPSLTVYDRDEPIAEPYILEVWTEKTSVLNFIENACRRLGVNMIVGRGEISITAIGKLLERATRPVRIFYISDFDPSGADMPVSIARKIEFYGRESGADIKLFPFIMSPEQIETYNLPRTEIEKKSGRVDKFEKKYGEGRVELEAMEEYYPGEMENLLEEWVNYYRDPKYLREIEDRKSAFEFEVDEANKEVLSKYTKEIEDAEEEYLAIASAMKDWKERFYPLYESIVEDLKEIEIIPPELPEPPTFEDHKTPLFSTDREYMEQLSHYKKFQNK